MKRLVVLGGQHTQLKQGVNEKVMHFAGFTLVGESMAEPGRYFENNLIGAPTISALVAATVCGRLLQRLPGLPVGWFLPNKLPVDQVIRRF